VLFSVLKIAQTPAAVGLKHLLGAYFCRYQKSKTAGNIFTIYQIYWCFFMFLFGLDKLCR